MCLIKLILFFIGMCTKMVVNIFTAVDPLFHLLKALGLFLPSFDRNFRITHPKSIDKVWALLTITALGCLIFNYVTRINRYSSTSVILVNAYDACTISGLVLCLLLMIYQHLNFNKILMILKMLHEFDEEVKKLNAKFFN